MNESKVSRWVLATGIAGTVFIAGFAFWLSFTALTHLAIRAGIAEEQAWAWPLIVDGIIVVATVAVVALRERKGHGYAWLLLICGASVSVTANAVQAAMPAGMALPPPLAAAVSAVPPIVLLAITHLTVVLARHENQSIARQTDPPTSPVTVAFAPTLSRPSQLDEAQALTPTTVPASITPLPTSQPVAAIAEPESVSPSPEPSLAHEQAPANETRSEPDLDHLSEDDLRHLLLGIDSVPSRTAADGVGEGTRTYLVEEARRLKGQGLTNRAIGERLGVDPTTIGRWLKKNEPGDTSE